MNTQEINKKIRGMLGKQTRFSVNMDDLRKFNEKLHNYVKKNPIQGIKMFTDSLNSTIRGMQEDGGKLGSEKMANAQDAYFPKKIQNYYINFEGNFGKNHVTPRGLRADLINQLVSVNGIVTKMSIVKPKIQTSVHYCEATKRGMIKNYNDQLNLNQGQGDSSEQTNAFPTKDANDNPLSTEYGFCIYKDSQIVTI